MAVVALSCGWLAGGAAAGAANGIRLGAHAAACSPNSSTLCLNDGRFQVRATFDTGTVNGDAQGVQLTSDTGYLYFLNAANVEVVLKVLDGCAVNGRYWVFAGGLTNIRTVITVTDTQTGQVKTYTNPQGRAFEPIQDTSAYATCP